MFLKIVNTCYKEYKFLIHICTFTPEYQKSWKIPF